MIGGRAPGGSSVLRSGIAKVDSISVLRLRPWRRAPLLLYREPGAFAAILASAFILAVAGSSAPLFLGTIGAAALDRTIEGGCAETAAVAVDDPSVRFLQSSGIGSYGDNASDIIMAGPQVTTAIRAAGLPAPERVLLAQVPTDSPPEFTLFSRPGALAHVELLGGSREGQGAWIPDAYAEAEQLSVGDALTFSGTRLPVTGIYLDLGGNGFEDILPEYWCTWRDLLVPGLESRPPPFVIVDESTMFDTGGTVSATWYSTLPPEQVTLAGVRDVLDRVDALKSGLMERGLNPPVGAPPSFESLPYEVRTELARFLERSEALSAGVQGPVAPVAAMATVIALCFVAAAGAFWVERRRRELRLLAARGVGPVALAVKAGLEVAPAVLAGSAFGWAGTTVMVRMVGPSQRFEPGAVASSGVVVGLIMLSALLLLGVTAGARTSGLADYRERKRSGWLSRVPWELGLLAAAIVLFLLRTGDPSGRVVRGVGQVNAADIALPLLILAGATLFMTRLLVGFLPAARRYTNGSRPSLFLAARRASAAALVFSGLAVFTAQPVGVYLYASAITSITEGNLQDKSATYSGAENAVSVGITPGSVPEVVGYGTLVSVVTGARLNGAEVQILGVQPESFADFATDVTDGALPGLMAALGTTANSAILVTSEPLDEVRGTVQVRQQELDFEVVDTVGVFPGMRSLGQSVLVVDRSRLADLARYAPRQDEVWTTDVRLPELLARLQELSVRVERVRTPDTLLDATDLLTVSWAFGYMRALAVLTGLIGASGLLLYLNLRSRKAAAAYVIARRMGLHRRQHLASLIVELLGLLAAAWAIGAAACFIALRVAGGRLDVDPNFPPPPEIAFPLVGASVTAGIVSVLAVGGALVAQRVADNTEPARVLRLQD